MHDDALFERARRLAEHLPGIEVAPYFGQPALKVNGKAIANCCRYPGVLAVHCARELKQLLIDARPDVYHDTDHFRNWAAILVRMDAIDDDSLQARLEAAWADRAPRKLVKAWAESGGTGNGKA